MNQVKKQRPIDTLFDVLLKHPYILVALFCLMLLPFGFSQAGHVTTEGIIIEAMIWCLAISAFIAFGKPSSNPKVNVYLIISSVLMIVLFSLMVSENENHSVMMFVPALIILAQLAVVLYNEKALTIERVVLLLIVLGIVVRYCYVLTFTCTEIQHDVGTFGGTSGHEPYIMYWYENGLTLPDFNVTTRWQFYHPPLHHILMALLLRILTTLGLSLDWAQEAIQILPMFYSALCMVVCFRIFKLVKLSGAGLVVSMILVCFFPTFIIWGGEYNNDMLAALFALSAIMWTLKWYRKPSFKTILPIALCIGFGMMAKLSAWMVAPAVALIFLLVFIKNIKKPLPFIGQFAAFGAVCIPLALWWGIRNLILFDVPITYVPDTMMTSMSVADVPALQRVFDFSLFQFAYPYEAFTIYHAPYNEYNPAMGLIKTSLFDEYNLPWKFGELATFLVVMTTVLAIVSLVYLFVMLFKKKRALGLGENVFFIVIVLTMLISYYLFCFNLPYVCSENIRFCIPLIPILAMSFGFLVNSVKKKLKKES